MRKSHLISYGHCICQGAGTIPPFPPLLLEYRGGKWCSKAVHFLCLILFFIVDIQFVRAQNFQLSKYYWSSCGHFLKASVFTCSQHYTWFKGCKLKYKQIFNGKAIKHAWSILCSPCKKGANVQLFYEHTMFFFSPPFNGNGPILVWEISRQI